jgi:hypothetical protein
MKTLVPVPTGATMEIDTVKFAALIRHFGEKFEEGEDECYMLSFPLAEWQELSSRVRVLPADNPEWISGKPSTVAFVAIIPKKKRKHGKA